MAVGRRPSTHGAAPYAGARARLPHALDVSERLGQKLVEPIAHDLDDHALRERFGFDRVVRAGVLEAFVVLDDRRQAAVAHLVGRQRQALQSRSR
jgi:hypothetical protein